jgi:glutaconate CoA-transferase, subunit B
VIGPYDRPAVRLPGGGGAPEIAAWCRETFVMLKQSPRTFVEELDFRTTAGAGVGGAGVTCVVTDLGLLEPDGTGELTLTELHPDVTVEQAREATGWELGIAGSLRTSPPPTDAELEALRALRPANGETSAA